MEILPKHAWILCVRHNLLLAELCALRARCLLFQMLSIIVSTPSGSFKADRLYLFDILCHFGVSGFSDMYCECVEKVLCRLTEHIFFLCWCQCWYLHRCPLRCSLYLYSPFELMPPSLIATASRALQDEAIWKAVCLEKKSSQPNKSRRQPSQGWRPDASFKKLSDVFQSSRTPTAKKGTSLKPCS